MRRCSVTLVGPLDGIICVLGLQNLHRSLMIGFTEAHAVAIHLKHTIDGGVAGRFG